MSAWLGSNWLRVAAYLLAAVAAVRAGWHDRRRTRFEVDSWPTFWFVTGGLLLIMAVGRATDIGGWVTRLGRTVARTEGW